MSLRLTSLRAPAPLHSLRSLRTLRTPALARTFASKIDGGDPGTGKWSTPTDPNATESEAEAQADENPAIPRRPDWRMQEATAEEAEAEFHASKPAKERIKEDVEKAVEDVKKALK